MNDELLDEMEPWERAEEKLKNFFCLEHAVPFCDLHEPALHERLRSTCPACYRIDTDLRRHLQDRSRNPDAETSG